jgi:hypothetical protein
MAKLGADLEELETGIIPQYQNMAADLKTKKVQIEKFYEKLSANVDQQGLYLRYEVNIAVNKTKSEIQMMKDKHLSALKRNSDEIAQKIKEIKHINVDLESILSSNDIKLASVYNSRNEEFKISPPKLRVKVPKFNPGKINKDWLNEMVGTLTSSSIITEASKTMESAEATSSPPDRGIKRETEDVSSPPTKRTK